MPTTPPSTHTDFRLRLIEINDSEGLLLAGPDDTPPTVAPDLVPDGWSLTGEVTDFEIGGQWVEAYWLKRTRS